MIIATNLIVTDRLTSVWIGPLQVYVGQETVLDVYAFMILARDSTMTTFNKRNAMYDASKLDRKESGVGIQIQV